MILAVHHVDGAVTPDALMVSLRAVAEGRLMPPNCENLTIAVENYRSHVSLLLLICQLRAAVRSVVEIFTRTTFWV